jgi:hypothetical protein
LKRTTAYDGVSRHVTSRHAVPRHATPRHQRTSTPASSAISISPDSVHNSAK